MRQAAFSRLGLAILGSTIFPHLGQAAITDVFTVKGGTTTGGCDGVKYDLPGMFNEASTIIDAAVDAFNDYNNDYAIRKLALSFFGVQMNDQLTAPKDQANTDTLTKIQGGFQSLKDFASASKSVVSLTTFKQAWLFCDSDWVETVQKSDDFLGFSNGQLVPWVAKTASGWPLAKPIPASPNDPTPHVTVEEMFTGRGAPTFISGQQNAYLSRDMGKYRLGDPNPDKVIKACAQRGEKGSTSLADNVVGVTLCLRGDNIAKAATLDTSQGEGTWLHALEMNSLTFIHEFYHAGTNGAISEDVRAWSGDPNIKTKNDDGSVNTNWPGDAKNFAEQNYQADSVTDTLILALANGRQSAETVLDANGNPQNVIVDTTNNPQNYAWAAMAAYLARNGAKLDYSTGVARPLDAQPAGPAPST